MLQERLTTEDDDKEVSPTVYEIEEVIAKLNDYRLPVRMHYQQFFKLPKQNVVYGLYGLFQQIWEEETILKNLSNKIIIPDFLHFTLQENCPIH